MTQSAEKPEGFRFPPLERRGLAGGLRSGQVLLLGGACVAAVLIFRTAPTAGGFVLSLLLVGLGLLMAAVPVRGRGVDEWAPVIADWLMLRLAGGRTHRSRAPYLGHSWNGQTLTRETDLPPTLDGTSLLGFPLSDDETLGVLRDRRQGAYTAVLVASVHSFGLLGAADQERQLASWGRALASVARDGTCIRRVQALERTVPHEGDELRDWLAAAGRADVAPDLRRSYLSLLAGADAVSYDHEVLLALQVDERRAWATGRTAAPRGADRDALACAALAREVRLLAARLSEADIAVNGLLTPAQLARAIRLGQDPYDRRRRGSIAAPETTPYAPAATEAQWDRFRCDGAVHRTYWVAQWPRLEVGSGFLLPLLLGPSGVRSVSLVAQPVPPARSRAAVEAAITSDEADSQVRQERGFRTTARSERQHAAARRRESELAAGHEELRFTGFVTVTGRDDDELDRACEAVVQAAQQSYLDLQVMYGQQDTGFACGALPLCRGLGRGGLLDP
jgi:hypothetical protein